MKRGSSNLLSAVGLRRRRSFVWLVLPLGLAVACSKIVGITDTEVTRDGGGGGSTAGGSGTPNGGSSGASMGGAGASSFDASSSQGGTAAAGGGIPIVDAASEGARGGGSVGDARIDGAAARIDAALADVGLSDAIRADAPGPDVAADVARDAARDATQDQVSEAGGCGPCPVDHPTCENGQCIVRGPTMVAVSSFFVDSTEVTVAEYRQFLTAKGADTSGQPTVCAWNTSYYDTTNPMNPDTWPISNVDWCDALAYCTWAGKHLCGRIGGGPVARADALTSNLSQWFLACGGPNGSTHPSSTSMCNSSFGFGDFVPVASDACEGFYPGLFDLEGNAAEWVDSCDTTTGASDVCHLLGGSILDMTSFCTESFDQPRNTVAYPFGFRCCGG